MAEVGALRFALDKAWTLFASKTASRIENGDIAEEQLRQLLLNEFQKIHEHLNALRRKDLVAAIAFLKTGYDLVSNDPATARDEFKKARDAAVIAFGVVPDVSDKIMATKILVLSTIHEFGDNQETAITLCVKYVKDMNKLPEVIKVCKIVFDKESKFKRKLLGLTGKTSRFDILKSIADINFSSWEFVSRANSACASEWTKVVWRTSNIHPIYDICLFRTSKIICDMDKKVGSIVSAVSSDVYLFLAMVSNNPRYMENAITAVDIKDGSIRYLIGHTGHVLSLASNDKYLFSGSFDRKIMVWDSVSLECLKILENHDGAVTSLCISEQYLFSASTDSKINIWSLSDFTLVKSLNIGTPLAYITCSIGKYLFSLSVLSKVQIWDVAKIISNELLKEIGFIDVGSTVKKILLSDRLLFACGRDSVEMYKLGSLRKENSINAPGYNAVILPSNKFLLCRGQDIDMWSTRYAKNIVSHKLSNESDAIPIYMWTWKGNIFVAYYDLDGDKVVLKKY